MPEISIITPVYNVEKYLTYCINSIKNQTFEDYEVIFIDDGSTDSSPSILEKYKKEDQRVNVIYQKNSGPSVARNTGINNARGKYIYFMDSDDALHPQCLEIIYDIAEKHHADLVCFDYEHSDGTTTNMPPINKNTIKAEIDNNPILRGCDIIQFNVWSKLYKRELLKDIRFIEYIHFEDYPFVYDLLSKRPNTVIIKNKLYYYTRNMSGISKQDGTVKQIQDYFTGIKQIVNTYKHDEYTKERKFLIKDFIPRILKHQIGRCRRASNPDIKTEMYKCFAEELAWLSQKGWIGFRGHKIKNWLAYRKLIKKNND